MLVFITIIKNLTIDIKKGNYIPLYTKVGNRKVVCSYQNIFRQFCIIQNQQRSRKHIKCESKKREERLSDIKLNRDGSIILAGTSAEELGKENWKIVKLGDKQIDQLIEKQDIKIYPKRLFTKRSGRTS